MAARGRKRIRTRILATSTFLLALAQTGLGQQPVPVGTEFRVCGNAGGLQSVSADATGAFVVVCKGDGIVGQRYDPAGRPDGAPFQVASVTSSYGGLITSSVSVNSSGDFVVAWVDSPEHAIDDSVFARRFDASANALGPPFTVSV